MDEQSGQANDKLERLVQIVRVHLAQALGRAPTEEEIAAKLPLITCGAPPSEQAGQSNDAERHDDFEAALAELDPEYEGEDYYRIIAPEEIKKIVARLRAARWPKVTDEALAIVEEQANDATLWFPPEHATEDILQRALRRLHAALENDPIRPLFEDNNG